MSAAKRPYTQAADFADLPSALLYLWHTFHFLPNSFPDQRTQQVLTSDCIKSCLVVFINSAKASVQDFCFNLTCRLCYSKFKALKTSNPALLAYICNVFTQVQSAPKAHHSTVDETVLLGRFPLPTRQVVESCLQFFETRPKSAAKKIAPSSSKSNLQVLQETSRFNPFSSEGSSSRQMGSSVHSRDDCQRSGFATNSVLRKFDANVSNEDDFAAQIAFNNLATFPSVSGTSRSTSSRSITRKSRSRSPPSSAHSRSAVGGLNRPAALLASAPRSRSRSSSPSSSRDTQPLTCTYVPSSPLFDYSSPDTHL